MSPSSGGSKVNQILVKSLQQEISSLDEFLTREIKPREYLIYPFLGTGDLVVIYAGVGIGKSLLGNSIAVNSIRPAGLLSLGNWTFKKTCRTFLLDGENSPHSLQNRLKRFNQDLPQVDKEGQLQILSNVSLLEMAHMSLNFNDDASKDSFLEMLDKMKKKPDIIIVDNLGAFFPGLDEVDGMAMANAIKWFLNFKSRGIATILFHHSGKKEDNLYGSSTFLRDPDCVINLHDTRKKGNRGSVFFEIKYDKYPRNCSREEAVNFFLQLETSPSEGLSFTAELPIRAKEEIALCLLIVMISGAKKFTQTKLAKVLHVSEGFISERRVLCIDKGYVTSDRRVTKKGESLLKSVNYQLYLGMLEESEKPPVKESVKIGN